MDIYNLLTIVFQNCQDDLLFVFKFRKISKRCKIISEFWLTSINDPKYLYNVDIGKFKNLTVLECGMLVPTKDRDLRKLKKLQHLGLRCNQTITNDGIKNMTSLTSLNIQRYYGIDNCIGNAGLKKLNLNTLNISLNPRISDRGIEHMTNLKYLFVDGRNSNITNTGLRNLNLYYLSANNNDKITNEGIEHMTDLFVVYAENNDFITAEGLKHLSIKHLYK